MSPQLRYNRTEHGREMRRLWSRSDVALAGMRRRNKNAAGVARRKRFEATEHRRAYRRAWNKAYRARVGSGRLGLIDRLIDAKSIAWERRVRYAHVVLERPMTELARELGVPYSRIRRACA